MARLRWTSGVWTTGRPPCWPEARSDMVKSSGTYMCGKEGMEGRGGGEWGRGWGIVGEGGRGRVGERERE